MQIIPKYDLPCEMEPPVIKFGLVWRKINLKIENAGALKPFSTILDHQNCNEIDLSYQDTVH